MKYIRQFGIILTVSFLGELLYAVIPLPIPASIYGLVLMLAALITGIIPLKKVRETGSFFIEIMPLTCLPGAVGLMNSWDALRPMLIPVLVIITVTTILVMIVSGKVTQAVIQAGKKEKRKKGKRGKRNERNTL